jgi:hypothetical protein
MNSLMTTCSHFALGLILLILATEKNMAASKKQINQVSAPIFHCKTQNAEYEFLISAKYLEIIPNAFDNKYQKKTRQLASMGKSQFTKSLHENFKNVWDKSFFLKGSQAKIHISNIEHPTDLNDYFSMKSPQGHKMTYGLNCSKI